MDIRRFLHAEFVFAALAAAAAGHALVSGVLLGRASSPLSGVLLAALLGAAAWYAWRTGWARWVGPDPEGCEQIKLNLSIPMLISPKWGDW